MLPIQELIVRTRKSRTFAVHLEKWMPGRFECKLAAVDLGAETPADGTFSPSSWGADAVSTFAAMIDALRNGLAKLDASDAIASIDNPNNTEFVAAPEQQRIVGAGVSVKVNGQAVR